MAKVVGRVRPATSTTGQTCITRDTVLCVNEVSIRELRNHGGEVVDRARRGERLTITRDGEPVAQLLAVPTPALSLDELRRRRARLPIVDPDALRRDVDAAVDPSL
jgi:prevent-host-death family protein